LKLMFMIFSLCIGPVVASNLGKNIKVKESNVQNIPRKEVFIEITSKYCKTDGDLKLEEMNLQGADYCVTTHTHYNLLCVDKKRSYHVKKRQCTNNDGFNTYKTTDWGRQPGWWNWDIYRKKLGWKCFQSKKKWSKIIYQYSDPLYDESIEDNRAPCLDTYFQFFDTAFCKKLGYQKHIVFEDGVDKCGRIEWGWEK